MPSAANAKSEKPASTEATDNSPVRQIMTIIEHKIRNLEKRKSKLTSYRDLQKAGKDLNADQKVAVAKYDEVNQTLEFARDFSKQVAAIATATEREAKKQAKRDAWVRCASETNKIREVLLILDCLVQMGNTEARSDFLNGTNGAVKLTEGDLKILDELYPEVTPKHELNEEGQPGFHSQSSKAAEHLYSIVDGRPKEFLGTTYTRIKEIVSAVHECGYFDRTLEIVVENAESHPAATEDETIEPTESSPSPSPLAYAAGGALPVPPAPAVVPAPAYPLRPLPPITLQEVEHAYFARQYPQQRPIAEVIGSQNFFFLQESEIDSPVGTPQPPSVPNQASPPAPIPTQTFTNQHFVQLPGGRVPDGAPPLPPQPHFPPHPDLAGFPPAPALASVPLMAVPQPPHASHAPHAPLAPHATHAPAPAQPARPPPHPAQPAHPAPACLDDRPNSSPTEGAPVDDGKESGSPERDDAGERRTQGQGDGQGRYRRYGRGGRGASDGHRGRGSYQGRQGGDGYRGRHAGEYQPRPAKDGHAGRQYDGYQGRHGKEHQSRGGDDGYYGNGDTGDAHQHGENGGRDRYEGQSYGGGFKARGRGGPRGRGGAPRAPRNPAQHYARKPDRPE